MSVRNRLENWQTAWAQSRGVRLEPPLWIPGSKKCGYVHTLQENLFEPISERVKQQFILGAGGELKAPDGASGNMYAAYSSSALCVNLFHPWSGVLDAAPTDLTASSVLLLEALGLPSMPIKSVDFEAPQIVNPKFLTSPHLDVQISFHESEWKCAGVEAKFCEPYPGKKHGGLDACYLREEVLWQDWSSVLAFAEEISNSGGMYFHLDASQLLKHLLGLRRQHGTRFILMYLWFDVPGSKEAQILRREIASFSEVLRGDGIAFVSRTYQEVFQFLRNCESKSPHVDYLVDRYLNGAPSGENSSNP